MILGMSGLSMCAGDAYTLVLSSPSRSYIHTVIYFIRDSFHDINQFVYSGGGSTARRVIQITVEKTVYCMCVTVRAKTQTRQSYRVAYCILYEARREHDTSTLVTKVPCLSEFAPDAPCSARRPVTEASVDRPGGVGSVGRLAVLPER